MTLPLTEIEEKVKNKTIALSVVHGYGHLRRTAIGAKLFASFFGESAKDQEIAYAAGLIHDLERPNTEKIDHSEISVHEAANFLSEFSLDKETNDRILLLISTHRHPKDIPLNEQWVYLSDKLFEQSGAYLLFRRSYYVGECEDYIDMPMEEAFVSHMKNRMKKFSPLVFHQNLRKLAEYQFVWQKKFIDQLEKKSQWANDLVKIFYDYGRGKKENFEKLIQNYNPIERDAQKFKDEALEYLEGKKYSFFESLLTK